MDENCKEIAELWAQGLSGSEIAKRLGITRGSVLGKVHRMRESGKFGVRLRDQRIRALREAAKKKNEERLALLEKPIETMTYKVDDKSIPLPVVNVSTVDGPFLLALPEPEPEPMRLIPFEKLTSRSCRFIVNSGSAAEFLFCGRTKVIRSYCEEHAKLCYLPPPKKEIKV